MAIPLAQPSSKLHAHISGNRSNETLSTISFDSLISLGSFDINPAVSVSEFALMLSGMRVPGPANAWGQKTRSLLGRGSQFTVYNQETNLPSERGATFQNRTLAVAIKEPNFILDAREKLDISDVSARRQIRNMIIEITALWHKRLRKHRNIVKLLAWGLNDSTWDMVPFIALELADRTLTDLLNEGDDHPLDLKHHLCLDIGCGLDAIHGSDLIHGDLKPDNVLLFRETWRWIARLADFGAAGQIGQGMASEGRGTMGWRAPEYRRHVEDGTPLDPFLLDMVDVYSYGLMLWSVFLKNRGSSKGNESLEAYTTALQDLHCRKPELPKSLAKALRKSFDSTLQLQPHLRSKTVSHLLNDGSGAYLDWYGVLRCCE